MCCGYPQAKLILSSWAQILIIITRVTIIYSFLYISLHENYPIYISLFELHNQMIMKSFYIKEGIRKNDSKYIPSFYIRICAQFLRMILLLKNWNYNITERGKHHGTTWAPLKFRKLKIAHLEACFHTLQRWRDCISGKYFVWQIAFQHSVDVWRKITCFLCMTSIMASIWSLSWIDSRVISGLSITTFKSRLCQKWKISYFLINLGRPTEYRRGFGS